MKRTDDCIECGDDDGTGKDPCGALCAACAEDHDCDAYQDREWEREQEARYEQHIDDMIDDARDRERGFRP